jgi:hypothetical protein
MSVFIRISSPQELVNDIRRKIKDGKIETWQLDSDGDLTHTSLQWRNRAWFHPIIEESRVVFSIIGRKTVTMTVGEYAAYHGRLVSMLLSHFDKQIEGITVTPLASTYDSIIAEKEQSQDKE